MMAKWKFVVICLATAIFSDVNFQSLADDDGGLQRGINDPEPFRLNKLNMMWEKAKKASCNSVSGLRHMVVIWCARISVVLLYFSDGIEQF